jgi:hypothetical protein
VNTVPDQIQAKQNQNKDVRNSTAGALEKTKRSQAETTDNANFDF